MLRVVGKVAVQSVEERGDDDRCAAGNGIVNLVKPVQVVIRPNVSHDKSRREKQGDW